MRRLLRLTLIVLGTTSASLWAFAQNGACFADWSQASIIVKTEGLVTVDQLTKSGSTTLGGQIVRSTLCEGPSGYVYKLVIRDADGQLKNVTVDAKRPF
jgi:hypothetical protein